ncbi:hypothetical protein JCM10450v2_003361 [Rhodotorula kratochvilovae]
MSLARLCRVSKRCRDIVQPILWRQVAVNSLRALVTLVVAKDGLRRFVSALTMSYPRHPSTTPLRHRFQDLARALPSVECLRLTRPFDKTVRLPELSTFSALRSIHLHDLHVDLDNVPTFPNVTELAVVRVSANASVGRLFESSVFPSLRHMFIGLSFLSLEPPLRNYPLPSASQATFPAIPPRLLAQLETLQIDCPALSEDATILSQHSPPILVMLSLSTFSLAPIPTGITHIELYDFPDFRHVERGALAPSLSAFENYLVHLASYIAAAAASLHPVLSLSAPTHFLAPDTFRRARAAFDPVQAACAQHGVALRFVPDGRLPFDATPTATARIFPACLSALPTELKSRIVRICAEQDEQVSRLLDALKKQGVRESLVNDVREDHPGTVRSLFEVSREWSALTAPYRFRVLKTSRVGDFVYRFRIAQHRAVLVEEIVCDEMPGAGFDTFLHTLPRMKQLRKLVIDEDFLDLAIGFSEPLDVTAAMPSSIPEEAVARLVEALQIVSSLDLRLVTRSRRLDILEPAHNLRSLRLDFTTSSPSADHLDAILTSIPAVTELSLVSRRWSTNVASVVPHPSAPFPALHTLSFTAQSIRPSVFGLISQFSSTLKTLSLDISQPLRNQANVPDTAPFPVLTRLALSGRDEAYASLAGFFTPTRLPSLEILRLEIDSILFSQHPPLSTLIQAFLDADPRTLSDVELIQMSGSCSRDEDQFLSTWSERDGFTLVLSDFQRPPSSFIIGPDTARAVPSSTVQHSTAISKALRISLEYLQGRLLRAYDSNGVDELARFARLLQRLEVERAVDAL